MEVLKKRNENKGWKGENQIAEQIVYLPLPP
jgi:hypothetical protein